MYNLETEKFYPHYFNSSWINVLHKRCIDNLLWTYHAKFKLYFTGKNYAVQFYKGIGSEGQISPKAFTKSKPVYKKDLEKMWLYIFEKLKFLNAKENDVYSLINKMSNNYKNKDFDKNNKQIFIIDEFNMYANPELTKTLNLAAIKPTNEKTGN